MDNPINYAAFRKAEIDAGRWCEVCSVSLTHEAATEVSGRRRCYDCRELDQSKDAVDHPSMIRCPACQATFDPVPDGDYADRYAEGDHEVDCPDCDHSFWITTAVSYSFASPPLLEDSSDG